MRIKLRYLVQSEFYTFSPRSGPKNIHHHEIDAQVRQYILHLRDKGAVVNTAIVQACAEGIVKP